MNTVISPLALVAILFWCPHAQAEGPPWSGAPIPVHALEIHVDTKPKDRFDWSGLAKDMVTIKRGDILTEEKWAQSQNNLKRFAHVQSAIRAHPSGAVLNFSIRPHPRIKTIAVQGAYPLFESDIRNLITVAPGDYFLPQMAEEQQERIVKRYLAEGYIAPAAIIDWEEVQEDNTITLSIHIEKGHAYALGRFEVVGHHAFSETLLKGRMNTWRKGLLKLGLGRLVLEELKEDVQNLIAFYRRQGYADVAIDLKVVREPQQKMIHARVAVTEGPRYAIMFGGNRFFDDAALQDDLALFQSGNRGNMGLRRATQNIRRRYLKAGFAKVRVRWQAATGNQVSSQERPIYFEIQEGTRHIVSRVTMTGNQVISSEAIQGQMLTRAPQGFGEGVYVASVLQEDVAAVRALYGHNGYLHTRIEEAVTIDAETRAVGVDLNIEEGPRTRVGQIRILGQPPVDSDTLRTHLPYRKGANYDLKMIQAGENALAGQLADSGYPHVQVVGRVELSEDRTRADMVYQINPGPHSKLGHLYWMGNFRTRDSLVARQMKLEEGAPFSLKQVLAAQRRLRDLGLFQSVQVRTLGLKEKSDTVHLLVSVVEKSPYFFELGAGYQTNTGIYSRIEIGDRNFLGLNKELVFGGEISEVGYRWDADIVEPRLLGSLVSADLNLFTEREEDFNQDFGTDTSGGKLTFSRPMGERFTVNLGVSYEQRQQFLRGTDAESAGVDPAALKTRSIWVTSPGIRFDSRDSFIRPRKGGLASLSADISRGLEDDLDNFIKYKLDVRTYISPKPRLVVAGRAFAGYIQSYNGEDTIPEDQLFFLGGTTDVRGFEENLLRVDADQDPQGGRLAMAASVEARYQLNPNWELTLFVDAGTIGNTLTGDDANDDWRWTYGTGLRYLTPIGPIGLLYGRKIDPLPGESEGAFHFSMGYTF